MSYGFNLFFTVKKKKNKQTLNSQHVLYKSAEGEKKEQPLHEIFRVKNQRLHVP